MHRAFRDENRSVKNHRNTITMDTYVGTCTAIYMASSYIGDNNIIMFDCEFYTLAYSAGIWGFSINPDM